MKLFVWGTGYYSDLLLEFGLKYAPCAYIESKRSNEEFRHRRVYYPKEASEKEYDAIIIANAYTEEILASAVSANMDEDKLLFMCPGNAPVNLELAEMVLSEYNMRMYRMSRGLSKYTWYDQCGKKDGKIYTCSYGNIENAPVMILRRHNAYTGIFSDYGIFLLYSIAAMKKGYIPVIDRREVANVVYQEREFYGKENAWEDYFYQPGNLTLEDVEKGYKNVACWNVQDAEEQYEFPNFVDGKIASSVILEYQKTAKQLFRYKEDIASGVKAALEKYIGREKRILGVSVREGYNKSFSLNTALGENHRIQPGIQNYLNDVSGFMEKWQLDYIFLACEAEETADAFRNKFKDKVILYDRDRFTQSQVPATLYEIGQNYSEIDKKKHCLDYIIEIECLAHCTSLVCGATSGNNIAMILKEGLYEHVYCYDFGEYHYGMQFCSDCI